MAGRNPKPKAMEALDGRKSESKLRDLPHPEPPPSIPAIPAAVKADAIARRKWDEFSRQLFALGLLTDCDADALAVYCVAYATWTRAERDVRKNGVTLQTENGFIRNPSVGVSSTAFQAMNKIGNQFGWTPSARMKISVSAKAEKDGENGKAKNPMLKYLKSG